MCYQDSAKGRIFKMYQREDWTLFRNPDTLAQQAGTPRIAAIVAKELVDNALDAIDGDADGQVTIEVGSQPDSFVIQDTGAGIDPNLLPVLFSINRPLTSSKLERKPTRGALGNGLRVVAGAVLATGGSLTVYTRNQRVCLYPQDNGFTKYELLPVPFETGTRIEVCLPGHKPDLGWAKMAIESRQGSSYRGKSSPWWYASEAFYELLLAAGERPVRQVIEQFEGCSGKKAGEIADGYQGRACDNISRDEADDLLAKARAASKPVKVERLGSIGDVLEGMSYVCVDGEFTQEPQRGQHGSRIPFLVEIWAFRSVILGFQVLVNKTPTVAETGVIRGKGSTLRFHASGHYVTEAEAVKAQDDYFVMLNIQTPYMPILSSGKAPDFTVFSRSIEQAISKAVRRAKSQRSGRTTQRATLKEVIFMNVNESADKASSQGRYRFSQRQLYYAMRPILKGFLDGKDPDWTYFCQVLTEYEAAAGDIPQMYRDNRGSFYHPHTGERIELGTISVEKYRRPDWTFNKVLFIEKEGFMPQLIDEGWAERHDCALVTSKGQPTRAVRDLLDLLGDSSEDTQFFCVHDADGAGTIIYQSLQEETLARARRRVEVINLGLEPSEGLDMGLQTEEVTGGKDRRVAVAGYVSPRWQQWLQKQRIELNSMPPAQFLDWLTRKFEGYTGKVIPPKPVITKRLDEQVEALARQQLTERILREGQFEERIQVALEALRPIQLEAGDELTGGRLDRALRLNNQQSWIDAVDTTAKTLINEHSDKLDK